MRDERQDGKSEQRRHKEVIQANHKDKRIEFHEMAD